MKNIFKKLMLSLLTLTVVFSTLGATAVFASENNTDDFNPYSFPTNVELETMSLSNEDVDDLFIIEALPNEKAQAKVDSDYDYDYSYGLNARSSSSTVAIMRIFAINDGGSSSFNFSGHAFLSIENVSNSTITVGGLSVGSGKTVTVGTWGNKSEHTGLWYNLEGYFQDDSAAFSDAVSLRVDLSSNLLNTVSRNIKNNDSWSMLSNCSTFATKIWNSVCTTTVSAGIPNTPTSTVNSIKSYSNLYSTGVGIPYFGTVYYGNPPVESSNY